MSNDLFPSDERMPQLSMGDSDQSNLRYLDDSSPPDREDKRVPIRGPSWLAWIIVIGVVGFIAVTTFLAQMSQAKIGQPPSKGSFFQPVFMGKIAVGMEQIGEDMNVGDMDANRDQILSSLQGGSVEQRFCVAILLNELTTPKEAIDKLLSTRVEAIAANVDYNPQQQRMESLLTSIFQASDNKTPLDVSTDDKDFLQDKLPWFGELVVHPPHIESDTRTKLLSRAKLSATIFFAGIFVGLVVFVAGLVVLVIFITQLVRDQFYSRIVDDSRYGPVYIETFALWLVLWLGISIAIGMRGGNDMGLATGILTMLFPLLALFWPIFRGVPAGEMFLDVGLKPANPIKEVFYGFVAYLAVLPLMALSLLATILLAAFQSMLINTAADESSQFAPAGVAHPIIGEAFSGNPMEVMALVFLMACVMAPLTEEIMFRGVLFRHLRDSTSRMRRSASVLVSAIISSFIFAAIHPQGLIGIPPLMTLAFAFCLVRQWRGSLIAPITMHALNNMIPTSVIFPVVL